MYEEDTRWHKPRRKHEAVAVESTDLREPPAAVVEHDPVYCFGPGCDGKRHASHRVTMLVYPQVPKAVGPTLADRGARVFVANSCSRHRGYWTVDAFLGSPAWISYARRFEFDFDSPPDPSLCQIQIARI